MANRKFQFERRKPQLHSLVDMSFILLLFFLITSMIAQLTRTEQKMSIPTPKNERGRAQILVQFISEDEVLYLDESASAVAKRIFTDYAYESLSTQINRVINEFMSTFTPDRAELFDRLDQLKAAAQKNPRANYFVVIRCPDDLPYFHVIDVMQAISGLPNIQCGCVGGTINDIRNAQNIRVIEKTVDRGSQLNLIIDFES